MVPLCGPSNIKLIESIILPTINLCSRFGDRIEADHLKFTVKLPYHLRRRRKIDHEIRFSIKSD